MVVSTRSFLRIVLRYLLRVQLAIHLEILMINNVKLITQPLCAKRKQANGPRQTLQQQNMDVSKPESKTWSFKGTIERSPKDIWDLPCFLHLLFWFHVSNYRNFWNNELGSLVLNTLASWNCFTCRNLFQNGANDMSECLTCETAFCKKAQNFV